MLAAAPELFVQAVRFSECLESMLRDKWAPTSETLENFAIGCPCRDRQGQRQPCDHNEMVANDEPGYAWKCAKCGHVYGKEDIQQ